MSDSELIKVFVSHHNDDAPALSLLKKQLEPVGFKCFLAHEDIPAGDNDLAKIEEELRECGVLLYIGNEKSNASAFCQQEIGIAKGLNKKIITTMTQGCPPGGFIASIQAITYTNIDNDFCFRICEYLLKEFPRLEETRSHLEILGVDGFSKGSSPSPNSIHLLPDNWDDWGFSTTFNILINRKDIGRVQIGYIGQKTGEHTSGKLLHFFTDIKLPFFSRMLLNEYQTELDFNKVKSLKHLLNDTTLMPDIEKNKIENEEVYQISLCR